MSDPFIVALIALEISLIASAVRMIDWFMHSDPRAVARMARWSVIVVAALSVPLVFFLLVIPIPDRLESNPTSANGNWIAAMASPRIQSDLEAV
jgi:cytochrome b561